MATNEKGRLAPSDPQEDLYTNLAMTEGDKFDNRLFWFTGGVGALSLGYFQATGTLRFDPLLTTGYSLLILSIIALLTGLQFSSYVYSELGVAYRERSNCELDSETLDSIDEKIINHEKRIRLAIPLFNNVALSSTIIGSILIIIFMFTIPQ